MDRFRKLLLDGYFPSQLPPPFTTNSFARRRDKVLSTIGPALPANLEMSAELFSQAKTGHGRRPMLIPNPIPQLYLANEIANSWREISNYVRKSRLSVSRIEFSSEKGEALKFTRMRELRKLRTKLSAGYRNILWSDVSQYFPSIYTHSIAWALHGKPTSKKRKFDKKLLGNRLDSCVALCQEKQTSGIPIGPATSHILAEIIGVAIDLQICELLGRVPSGYRQVDDFFLCFDDYKGAEEGLAAIVQSISAFQLQPNDLKTRIVSLEDFEDENWAGVLDRLEICTDVKKQESDIQYYFEEVFSLQKRYSDESIIKYALIHVVHFLIHEESWGLFESYLGRLATIYTNNLEIISETLLTYKSLGYPINESLVSRICNTIIVEHAPLEHHSEVAWALFLAREFDIKLSDTALQAVSKFRSSICGLLALDLRERGLTNKYLDTAIWDIETTRSGLRGSCWLYAYEAPLKGWITAAENRHIENDKYFSVLKSLGVSFYDPKSSTTPLIERKRKDDLPPGDEFLKEPDYEDEIHVYHFSEIVNRYRD